jgi:hypothetical protein
MTDADADEMSSDPDQWAATRVLIDGGVVREMQLCRLA